VKTDGSFLPLYFFFVDIGSSSDTIYATPDQNFVTQHGAARVTLKFT